MTEKDGFSIHGKESKQRQDCSFRAQFVWPNLHISPVPFATSKYYYIIYACKLDKLLKLSKYTKYPCQRWKIWFNFKTQYSHWEAISLWL